jgi:predicted nucleic acid-binding protein
MSAESSAEFVDSNVLVYLHDVSAGSKREQARELVDRLWQNRRGCLSIQVLQEFYVNVTQKVPTPLPVDAAWRLVFAFGGWRTHRPATEDVLAAIELQQRHRVSFWDGMILRSAGSLGCGIVWSEDLNAGQLYDGVRVLNPFATS